MPLLIVAFLAGLLTVLAPCILPLLPIIVGGSAGKKSRTRPIIITVSLALSIILFTLLLKTSTLFIQVPPLFWQLVSGGIIIGFGLVSLFPNGCDKLAVRFGWGTSSQRLLAKAGHRKGLFEPILIGAALGPVFASCSPTYAIILATVLPANLGLGLVYLLAYAVGLSAVMLVLGYTGQHLAAKLGWLANPHGWFRRGLGLLFVVVGLMIITGVDKRLESFLLDHNLAPSVNLEKGLLPEHNNGPSSAELAPNAPTNNGAQFALASPIQAPELAGIQSWINSNGESIAGLKGKVILVDFWTYSCINCIHTLPHVEGLYEKYKDQGLVVLGIHAPEFSFEKVPANVAQAVKDDHLTYPVGLDSNMDTWNAYHNQYWPAEYFIDRQGRIRHYYFGEGGEANNELVIRALLAEGGTVTGDMLGAVEHHKSVADQSPETYLGYARAQAFANDGGFHNDQATTFTLPTKLDSNFWALGGSWKIGAQDTVSGDGAKLQYKFTATDVYLVMGAGQPASIKVLVNGRAVDVPTAGSDVLNGVVTVGDHRLYRLVHSANILRDATLELQFPAGVTINAFTFDS